MPVALFKYLRQSQRGAALIDNAIMMAIIVCVAVIAAKSLGDNVKTTYFLTGKAMSGQGTTAGPDSGPGPGYE